MRALRVRAVAGALALLTALSGPQYAHAVEIAQDSSDRLDVTRFADPRPDSRPAVLWFWNGTVTPALVDRQLGELREQGGYEAIVFPFDTTALKPAFFVIELEAYPQVRARIQGRTFVGRRTAVAGNG